MKRELAIEIVRVTEAAALAAAPWMGKGDKKAADQAAVDAMRAVLDTVQIDGIVVIGEGEKDEAPMLYNGEQIGNRDTGEHVDIAVDPLEGTRLVARGLPNALAVLAISERGSFYQTPLWYMEKIAVGEQAKGSIDIEKPVKENLENVARALGKRVTDLTVIILDRPRHNETIRQVREAGARIKLISDGDVAGGIATAIPETGVDMLLGIGGAPEGVLTAAALKCLGGEIQARFKPQKEEEIKRARELEIDLDQVLNTDDLVRSDDVMFAVTGVTDGELLKGVRFYGQKAATQSIVMRSRTGTVRYIQAFHKITQKPAYVTDNIIR